MFKKTKISTELYILLFGMALVLCGITAFGCVLNIVVSDRYQEVVERYDAANVNTSDLSDAYSTMTLSISDMFNEGNIDSSDLEKARSVVSKMSEKINNLYASLSEELSGTDAESLLSELQENGETQSTLINDIFTLANANRAGEATTKYTSSLRPVNDTIDDLSTELSNRAQEIADQNVSSAEKFKITGEVLVIVVAVLMVLIAISFGIYVVKDIRKPLAMTVDAVKKVAVGDINVSITKMKENEFGELADALAEMIDREKMISEKAELVSQGDMTVELRIASEADTMCKALQSLVTENNDTLTNIHEASSQVDTGANQVSSASQALAQGSTEQASALQEVSASVVEVSEKVKRNAEMANEANKLMIETKENAANGNSEMSLTIEAMGEINVASENISKIIKTIDDIAFQTNILALNAAVEAARAGEHGKGFAVVAEEVRNLAAKSAEAASETAEMIENAIQKIHHGSTLASNTAEKLEEIIGNINNVVGLMSDITVASNDQATAVMQIDQALSQVSEVVQTNSATSEQCAAASEELANQAKNLQALVGRYKLKKSHAYGDSAPGGSFTDTAGSFPRNEIIAL